MNRTAKVVKQSVMTAMLVIVSLYVGVQLGAGVSKQVLGQKFVDSGPRTILVDNPVMCPKC